MTFDLKEIIELAAFGWGIFSWSVSRKDKRVIQDRQDMKSVLNRYQLHTDEEFREQKTDIKDLGKTVNEMKTQLATMQVKIDNLEVSSKNHGASLKEFSDNMTSLVGHWNKKIESFGKVVIK